MPVKPTVHQAAGKNNIRPTTTKNPHGHAPASSAADIAAQASLVVGGAVTNANEASAELHKNATVNKVRSSDECKQKVGALLRDWDWN